VTCLLSGSSAAKCPPTPISAARRRRARRTIRRVAAIAATVGLVGGAAFAALGPLSRREAAPRPASTPGSPPSVETEARRAADLPGAQIVQLTNAEGAYSVDVVMLPDGRAYVLGSQLPDGDAPYLLYALVGETRVLLGTLLGDGAVRLDRIPAGALLFALVDEAGAVVAGASLTTSAAPEVAPEAPSAVGEGASPSTEEPAPATPAPFTPPPDAPSLPAPSAEQPPPPPPDGVIDLPLLPPIPLPLFG
jgi:hypothetical protein